MSSLRDEINKQDLCIISHPDAGKTTLTEIAPIGVNLAGSVRQRTASTLFPIGWK